MDLDWSDRKISDWRELLLKVPRSNWMQTWPYAKAVRMKDQKTTRLAVIREGDESLGLMAIQEIKLGPVHFVNLHRGPLWFDDNQSAERLKKFAEVFNKTFPRRFLRRRRWVPEWSANATSLSTLSQLGFKIHGTEYKTYWLDLNPSLEDLRQGLKQKWRNALNKAERSKLKVLVDVKAERLDLFLSLYQAHKLSKGYLLQSPSFIKEEIKAALPFREALLIWAYEDHLPVAGVMVLIHGRSASYRVGWTTPSGRASNAHNLLLWKAVQVLKDGEISSFDLGGVDFEKGAGISKFKQGLGGKEFISPGVLS